VWYAVSQINPRQPVTGTGALADIVFRALAPGTAPIEVTYRKPVHRDGSEIRAVAVGGLVVIGGSLPPPTDGPSPTATSTRGRRSVTPSLTTAASPVPSRSPTSTPTRRPTDALAPAYLPFAHPR
jgi:hypothetical protein